jgi:hypothetical protein
MSPNWSRRRLLVVLPVVGLAGCTGGSNSEDPGDEATTTARGDTTPSATGSRDSTPTTGSQTTSDPPTASPTPTQTATMNPQDQIDRLPEPSPLTSALQDLVLAEDRERFANNADIQYRDGTVKVELELVEGGEPPRDLLDEIETEYGTLVVAWVRVDDLVDVALADDVRIVRRHARPKTH